MKIIKNPTMEDIQEAILVLANGGVVLYPTDTVYGLAANIFNKKAVKRIYEIKHRDLFKPLSILVSDIAAISTVADITEVDEKIINMYLPGPYTFILEKTPIVPLVVTSGLKQVGVRVPDNEIACKLASIFPITTTSANLSDEKVLSPPDEILEQLGCEVDLVLDVGKLDSTTPSTLIDLVNHEPKFLKR
ncbi:MAG: threonylcarbamoyl-AMP synthase [archaeon]|nr:threonylcarbamoyl-AMP synthase [archaeon]